MDKFLYLMGLILLAGCGFKTGNTENSITLHGQWQFQIDSLDVGISEEWFNADLAETIMLPGSMAENGKGNDVTVYTQWTGQIVDSSWFIDDKYARYREPDYIKIPFWLQPVKHYVGPAWYQREIEIPASWSGQSVKLFLERCHWETIVWIDGKKVGMNNSLSTPHIYDITGFLSETGNYKITIRVDNRVRDIDPGQNAHSITDHTQTNWNGIIGSMYLESHSPVFFEKVKIYPDVTNKRVLVKLNLINESGEMQDCTLKVSAEHPNHKPEVLEQEFELSGDREMKIHYPMGENPLLWDEFQPNVYTLSLQLESPAGSFQREIDFGIREFKVDGSRFTVNGRPVFLRGTLECAIFPKTGYPSTDVRDWDRIFSIIKAHGLNHVRFHSWCPPEAAFIAADRAGIYLQVESAAWATIGDGKPIDPWLYDETAKIIDMYGNHPSFCLMAHGNEPDGANSAVYLSEFVSYWIEKDPRRVYTSGAGWPAIPEMDFYNPMDPRIQRWGEGLNSIINREPPQTMFDYRNIIERHFPDKPVISHEIGQWCAYPNLKEIDKYNGVLRAKNFEIFRETLEENNMGHLADDFLLASGKLQALCYKADIEAALRTPGFAGFQLLDLHDFPGQGTALIGILDAFWDEKGYISPQEFSKFSNQTVPLARLEKRIFVKNETIEAEIEVAHFGQEALENVTPAWKISIENGIIIRSGDFEKIDIPIGNCITLGKINVPLEQIDAPQKIVLTVNVDRFANQWDLWIFSAELPEVDESQILITSVLDDKAVQVLENGGRVLLSLRKNSLKSEKGGDIKVGFSSIFWNTAWTRKQAPHTLGILCDPKHPALSEFPTEFHSNWQWWDAMSHSHAINLNSFANQPDPIVRIIDDWFENRPLGLLFEARVGKGKMLISGIDFWKDMDKRPEARQLLYSIQKYMASDEFNPESEIDIASIADLFKEQSLMEKAKIIISSAEFPGFEATYAIDNDPETFWHTPWEGDIPKYPHELQIDLGEEIIFSGFKLLPRQDGITGGWISEAEFYVSTDGNNWGEPVAREKFQFNSNEKIIILNKTYKARYIRFVALKGFQNQEFASLAELELIR
jgi:hypothetical protein